MADFIRPTQGRVTSPFGMRTHPVTRKPTTPHWGVDFGKDAGTRIIAAAGGKVSRVQRNGTFGTYGNLVMIVHEIGGKTYETVYAHLASIGVKVGQVVGQGAVIGVMGTTGGSTGVHLHFEVHVGRWNNRYSNAVDPMLYVDVVAKPAPAAPIKSEGGVRMFKPSSKTLDDAYTKFLQDAIAGGHLNAKWLVDFKAGKLTLDDALALKVIVDARK